MRPGGALSLHHLSLRGALCPASDIFPSSVPAPYAGTARCGKGRCSPPPAPHHAIDGFQYIVGCRAGFFKPSFLFSLPFFSHQLQLRSRCDPRTGIAARDGDDTFMSLGLIKQLLTLFTPRGGRRVSPKASQHLEHPQRDGASKALCNELTTPLSTAP